MTINANLCPNPSGAGGTAYMSAHPSWSIANDLPGGGQRYFADGAVAGNNFCEFGTITIPALPSTAAVTISVSWVGTATRATW